MVKYYRDIDGDGYGNSDDWMWACAAPSGYAADNTDCMDTSLNCSGDVHQGQNSYFASACDMSWDYDCDGVNSPERTAIAGFCHQECNEYICYCVGEGWDGQVAACGETGNYQYCFGIASCVWGWISGIQACR